MVFKVSRPKYDWDVVHRTHKHVALQTTTTPIPRFHELKQQQLVVVVVVVVVVVLVRGIVQQFLDSVVVVVIVVVVVVVVVVFVVVLVYGIIGIASRNITVINEL